MSRSNTPICPACSAKRQPLAHEALTPSSASRRSLTSAIMLTSRLGPAVRPARQPPGRGRPARGSRRRAGRSGIRRGTSPAGRRGRASPPPGQAIVGMQRRLVFVGVAADLAAAFGQVEPEQGHPFLRPGPGAGREVGFPGAHPAGVEGGAVARFSFAEGGLDGVGGHPAGFYGGFDYARRPRRSQPLPTTALARFPLWGECIPTGACGLGSWDSDLAGGNIQATVPRLDLP